MSSPSESLELVKRHLQLALAGGPVPSFTEPEADAVVAAVAELCIAENLSHVTSLGLFTAKVLLQHMKAGWQADRATRLALVPRDDSPRH